MFSPFQSKRAIWRSVGLFLVIGVMFFIGVMMPTAGEPYGSDAPDVHLPSMRNSPEQPGTHKLDLEVQDNDSKK